MSKNITTSDFIVKANNIFNNLYDYSKFEYINATTKSTIICPIHGEFQKDAHHHLRGQGCPVCAKIQKGLNHRISQDDFIEKVKKIFPNYDYSLVNYQGYLKKIDIICRKHGKFSISAGNLLSGEGCPICGRERTARSRKLDTSEVIFLSKQVHGDKYDYSKTFVTDSRTKIEIICPIHGSFWQRYDAHIQQKQGCPKCSRSKGEQEIQKFLENNHIRFIPQYGISIDKSINKSGKAYIDFYLPDYNTAIEYNGEQHYEYISYFHKGGIIYFEKQQKRDQEIKKYCKDNEITLLKIRFDEIVEKVLENWKQATLFKDI